MTPEIAIDLARQALWATIVLVGPVLIAGALAGLITSLIQAVTQIHEQTLTFLPKIAASINLWNGHLYVPTGGNGIVDEFGVAANGALTEIGAVTVPGAVGGEGIVTS